MTVSVWRATEHPRRAWKNGGGVTREVAGAPPAAGLDDFDWRISLAEVRSGGPFSRFDGVDRVIVLVDGEEMVLTVAGERHQLHRYRPFAFDGAAPTTCELPAGPTRDLNVMTRRGRVHAAVDVRQLTGGAPIRLTGGETWVLVTLEGSVHVSAPDGARTRLAPLDAASGPGSARLAVGGTGMVALVRLWRAG